MMLKGRNSHFSSKQNLLSTRTHWEQFQAVHAVTWIHCPAGRFKPNGMGLENAWSCPHSRHLHGLWMKCSGSGIPGERGPRASHTSCNILNFQGSPLFHVQKHPDAYVSSKLSSSCSSLSPPPQSRHILHPSYPLSGGKLKPSGFSVIQKPRGGGVVPLSISSNKLTWHQVKNTQHGTHKHPQRAFWNPIPRLGWKTL